jgi:hypothetical protein
MTTTTTISCPHCGATNPAGAAFCESCGKALPAMVPTGPRVVTADALPQTAIGHRMVGDELVKQQKKASSALLIVGILQMTCGAIALTFLSRAAPTVKVNPIYFIIPLAVGGAFIGLYFWSRKSPLPATIVGLVLYVTIVVINVVTQITTLAQNPDAPRTGLGGIGIGWLDIVVIAILAQAIGAGLKYKRLLEAQGGGFPIGGAAVAPPGPPFMPPPPPPARGV